MISSESLPFLWLVLVALPFPLTNDEGERYYYGGTSWLGIVGLTAVPFIISTPKREFAPYLEAAWQLYFSDNTDKNPGADFLAHFRFSTGLRWTMQGNCFIEMYD